MQNTYVGSRGYMALGVQTDKSTTVTPSRYVPYFKENLTTAMNKREQGSVKGNRNAVQDILAGLRNHRGSVEVLAEPNTAAHIFNMFMTKGAPSGSGPYTHPFTVGDTENYYTVDIKKGYYVHRFIGVKANSISPSWVDNEMHLNVDMTALKHFEVATLSGTPTGSGPYTVTLSTDYDPSPTTGLVTGDVIEFNDGTTVTNATVASVSGVTTFTTATDVTSYAAGTKVRIRAATPSFTLLTPFMWARTEFRFAADASTALSATHTPGDEGSEWVLTHSNESDDGAHQTGSYDPSDLRRTNFGASLTFIETYENDTQRMNYLENEKQACVIRMFAGNTTSYELRITLNNIKATAQPVETAFETVTKITSTYTAQYDSSDAQAVDVKVLNNLSTIA